MSVRNVTGSGLVHGCSGRSLLLCALEQESLGKSESGQREQKLCMLRNVNNSLSKRNLAVQDVTLFEKVAIEFTDRCNDDGVGLDVKESVMEMWNGGGSMRMNTIVVGFT